VQHILQALLTDSIVSNVDSTNWLQSAPLGPAEHIITDPVDRHRGLTHEQHGAERFSPPAGSLAMYDVDRTTHHFEPGMNMSPQLHVGKHPCDPDEFHDPLGDFEAPMGGLLGVNDWDSNLSSLPGLEGLNSGPPAISIQPYPNTTIGGSVGGDGSDVHSSYVNHGDSSTYGFSSNPASPSPVITPGESPGLGPTISFGPVRPPLAQPAVRQPYYSSSIGYPFPGDDVNARGSNSPPDNRLGWAQAMAGNCPPPCIYVPQPRESGEEIYEAEAEEDQFDVEDRGGIGTSTALSQHGIPPKKKRRPFTDDRRVAVHDVRKLGACIRCQYLRESVRLD